MPKLNPTDSFGENTHGAADIREDYARDAAGVFASSVPVVREASANAAVDSAAAHPVGENWTGFWTGRGEADRQRFDGAA